MSAAHWPRSQRPLCEIGRLLRCLLSHDHGNAAVEMGLCAGLLVLMISAAAAFGSLIFQCMSADNAVEGGVAYSIGHVSPSNFSTANASIKTAVGSTGGLGVTATAPTGFWGCSTSSGVTDQAPTCSHAAKSCSVTCANGFVAGYYVTVPAQYAPFGNYILSLNNFAVGSPHTVLPSTMNLSTTVRLQ